MVGMQRARRSAPGLAFALAVFLGGAAQAATILGFDAFVGGVGVTAYEESGYRLTSDFSIFSATGTLADPPGVFSSQATGTLVIERLSERPFDAVSIGVREINDSVGAVSVLFTGELAAGGIVTTTFTSDGACCGVDFGLETFPFPDTFRGLRSLSWVRADAGSVGVFDDVVVDFPAIGFDAFVGGVTSFTEDGFRLDSPQAINASATAPEPPAIFPTFLDQPLQLRSDDGGVFDLFAFEARELNDSVGPQQIDVSGLRLDGTTVNASFVTDGLCCSDARVGFELFELPDTFRQLVQVEWLQPLSVSDDFEATLAAPENDAAAAASVLPAGGGERRGTLVRASNDAAVSLGSSAASADVWYAITPASGVELAIDTCGTNDGGGQDAGADTVVTVHDALPASDANQIAGNDNAPDGGEPQACGGQDGGADLADSALSVALSGGETVWIRVARAGGSSAGGDFVLHVPEPEPGLAGGAALAALFATRRRRRSPRAARSPRASRLRRGP